MKPIVSPFRTRQRSRWSLRAKVLVPLVGLFILLEAVSITGAALFARGVALDQAREDLEGASEGAARGLNESVEARVRAIELASKTLAANEVAKAFIDNETQRSALDREQVPPLLAAYSKEGFVKLLLVRPDGRVVEEYRKGVRAAAFSHEAAPDLSRQACFVAPQFTEGVYVSPVGVAPGESGSPNEGGARGGSRLCVAHAYWRPDGSLAGVLLGVAAFDEIALGAIPYDGRAMSYVYSLSNGPLTGGAEAERFSIVDITDVPDTFWRSAGASTNYETDRGTFVGHARLVWSFSSAGASSDYWYVVSVVHEDAIGAQALRLAQQFAVLSGGALLAVAGVLGWTLSRALKPVRELAAATERVGGGDFTQRVVVNSTDELRDLAEAFNGMVSGLGERERRLGDYSKSLARSEKLAAIGTLAAGVAHEINNPLAFIKGNEQLAEMLLADVENDPATPASARAIAADVRESLRVNQTGVARIERIVQSLRQFAKPSTQKEPVRVREVVDAMLTLSQNRWRATGVEVQTHFPDDLPRVRVNPDEIGQVVLNLIVNAVDALGDSGGKLVIRGRADGDCVAIDVTDSGCGIPEHIARHLFTPFVTTKATGTGLGLSISHRIVEEHGGTMSFASEVGTGSTFTIRLPAEPAGAGVVP